MRTIIRGSEREKVETRLDLEREREGKKDEVRKKKIFSLFSLLPLSKPLVLFLHKGD